MGMSMKRKMWLGKGMEHGIGSVVELDGRRMTA
jgi:hypothetical protein